MSKELLQLFVNEAVKDGVITEIERRFLEAKAAEYKISLVELEDMIRQADQTQQSASGFITSSPDQNTSPSVTSSDKPIADGSGFILDQNTSETPPATDSGFITNAIPPVSPSVPPPAYSQSGIGNYTGSTPGFGPSYGFTDVETLGEQGAMSLMQKARYDRQWVVVKRLLPEHRTDPAYIDLFFKEYTNGRELRHEHIVDMLGRGEDADGPYFFMEYVDGQPLSKRIPATGIKEERLIRKIAAQILEALEYAHKKQIVHRDLKPDNILITNRGDNVKLIDFGLATADKFEDIAGANFVGTKKYAAPEQTTNPSQVDGRADLYAFGLILLEMFTGSVDKKDVDKVGKSYWRNIIHKCLKKDPEDRYHDAGEILDLIDQNASGIVATPAESMLQQHANRAKNNELEKQQQLLKQKEAELKKKEEELRKQEKKRVYAPPPRATAPPQKKRSGCLSVMLWIFLLICGIIAVVIYKLVSVFSAFSEGPLHNYSQEQFRDRITNYYAAMETHNFDRVEDFYRPNVDRFFTSRQVTTGDIRIKTNLYWKTTPEERHEIDWNTFNYTIDDEGKTATITFLMDYHYRRTDEDWQEIRAKTVIKVDGDLKIFYIAGR